VYVRLADHERRAIVLSGLDYPYGYLLVDPGGPERILTGIYSSDALFDEFGAYFDLPVDADNTGTTGHHHRLTADGAVRCGGNSRGG
jgi:hypothetical protein